MGPVRRRPQLGLVALAVVTLAGVPSSTAGAFGPVVALTKPTSSAFVQSAITFNDAADPAVRLFGTTYYAYTTGTPWGNHIGILRSGSPERGYRTITGTQWGSSAFPSVHYSRPIRPWQVAGRTQAPGVFAWAGRYVMFYAAKTAPSAGHGGRYCLSVATAARPEGPFADTTTRPWLCMDGECGVIDPQPWGYGGSAYLYFKSYDDECNTTQDSKIWVIRLGASGVTAATLPKLIVNQKNLPDNTRTVENPQMLYVAGKFMLLYSRGDWDSSGYHQSYVLCTTPMGPCGAQRETIVKTYPNVRGPGGGTIFRGVKGTAWIAYHGWQGPNGCTRYLPDHSCIRRLFVARLNI